MAQEHASADKWLDDPVFGLSVNMDRQRYEPMPTRIAQICRNLPRGKFWVFASHQVADAEYFLVSGFARDADSDPLGNLVVIQGTSCTGEPADWLLATLVPKSGYGADTATYILPGKGAPSTCDQQGDCRYTLRSPKEEALVRGLMRDAIARGSKAWGATVFRKKACDAKSRAANAASSQIAGQELEAYCKSK